MASARASFASESSIGMWAALKSAALGSSSTILPRCRVRELAGHKGPDPVLETFSDRSLHTMTCRLPGTQSRLFATAKLAGSARSTARAGNRSRGLLRPPGPYSHRFIQSPS